MIVHRCPQGGDEWHRLRAGKQTASNFWLMRESARLKVGPDAGDYSAKQKDHAFALAIERVSGVPLAEGFETWQMSRGRELEPAARNEHEIQTGLIVETCGFITTDDGLFGASLDGVIGDEGRAEYKAFVSPIKLRAIITGGDLSGVIDQCQGGLWVSQGTWIDLCLYCPALAPAGKQLTRFRIYRDDDFIEALESDLMEFKSLIDSYEAVLRAPAVAAEIGQAKPRLPRRKLPAPLPEFMKSTASAGLTSRFERLLKRIAEAKTQEELDVLLDGIGDLPGDEQAALRVAAASREKVS